MAKNPFDEIFYKGPLGGWAWEKWVISVIAGAVIARVVFWAIVRISERAL